MYEDYSCLDTFRGTQNDILYIFCHNLMGPDCQRRISWDAALHTDVRFRYKPPSVSFSQSTVCIYSLMELNFMDVSDRKYLQYVAADISDWMIEEERKKEALKLRGAESALGNKRAKCHLSILFTQSIRWRCFSMFYSCH